MILHKVDFTKDMWTEETNRRALRTFGQVLPGLVVCSMCKKKRNGVFLGALISTGIAAYMNIEIVPDGNPGNFEEPGVEEWSFYDLFGEEPGEGADDEPY